MRDRVKLIVNNREIQKRYLGNRLVWEAIRKLYSFRKNVTMTTIYNPTRPGQGFIMQTDIELNKYIEKTRKLIFTNSFDKKSIEIEVESVVKTNNTAYLYVSQNEYAKARSSLPSYIEEYIYSIDLYGI